MLEKADTVILQNALLRAYGRWVYYRNMALLLLLFSWGLYLAVPRTAFLIQALILTAGIAYYPIRHYLKFKNIKADLAEGSLCQIETFLYAKKKSNINRLQPYYYLYTNDQTFEVEASVYAVLNEQSALKIRYAPRSKVLVAFQIINEDSNFN